MGDIDSLRASWPEDVSQLPADVQQQYAAWLAESDATRMEALRKLGDACTRPDGPYQKTHKARDLVLLRSPFPRRARNKGPPLTQAQVAAIGSPVPEPVPMPEPAPVPAQASVDQQLAELKRQMEEQSALIARQQGVIKHLFDAQSAESSTGREISSSYPIAPEVLDFLGKNDDGECSWLRVMPLARKDRNLLMHEHSGKYDTFPPELDLIESTRTRKDVQSTKITLQQFAQENVSKFMMRNEQTIRMCGTTYSRVLEMRKKVEDQIAEDQVDQDQTLIPAEDIVSFLKVVEGASSTSLQLAVDTQTHMRLAVSSKVERAMGVAHLRQDPFKKKKEDFISPDTYKLIEEAAKRKQNLTWAQSALKKGVAVGSQLGTGLSHGGPPRKTSGAGKKKKNPFSNYKGKGGGNTKKAEKGDRTQRD